MVNTIVAETMVVEMLLPSTTELVVVEDSVDTGTAVAAIAVDT